MYFEKKIFDFKFFPRLRKINFFFFKFFWALECKFLLLQIFLELGNKSTSLNIFLGFGMRISSFSVNQPSIIYLTHRSPFFIVSHQIFSSFYVYSDQTFANQSSLRQLPLQKSYMLALLLTPPSHMHLTDT